MTRSWLLVLLILLIHLVLLLNTRFTLWPEMVVYPFLLNNGFLLYRDIINPYPPFLTGLLAIFARITGYSPFSYQILTWFLILIIDLIVFYISKKIFKKTFLAVISLLFFVILSLPFSVYGLWLDLFQTPFILLATYYFYQYLKKPKVTDFLFLTAFCLTVAFFIKQQILWLFIWFMAILIFKFGRKSPTVILRNLKIIVPFLFLMTLEILLFWQKGILADLIYWTIYFPFFEASTMPGYILLPTLRQFLPIATLFLIFIPTLLKKGIQTNFLISTAFVSLFFAYPRFDYFHLIPTLAILSVAFGQNLKNLPISNFPVRVISLVSLLFLIIFSSRYLMRNWHQEVRFFEKDITRTAAFLEKNTSPDEPIYIQNGPDQILPLANRLPVKPWADEFPWYLERKDVQDKVVDGIINQNPRFVIFKPYDQGTTYEIGAYRPQKIADYIGKHYQNLEQISDTLWLKTKK